MPPRSSFLTIFLTIGYLKTFAARKRLRIDPCAKLRWSTASCEGDKSPARSKRFVCGRAEFILQRSTLPRLDVSFSCERRRASIKGGDFFRCLRTNAYELFIGFWFEKVVGYPILSFNISIISGILLCKIPPILATIPQNLATTPPTLATHRIWRPSLQAAADLGGI